jgi:8-oxo-dGTP pyrophosphatase MutT (NUDIX family)
MSSVHFLSDASPLQMADAVAALIVVPDGRYLLQLRDDIPKIFYPGYWGCFGGAVNAGEDPRQALKRELFEEIELEVRDCKKFVGLNFDLTEAGGGTYYRDFFEVNTTEDEIKRLVLHEGVEMKLFTSAELHALPNVTPYDSFALWLHGARGRLV